MADGRPAQGQGTTLLIFLLKLSGGAGRNAVLYANILAGAGHRVTLVCGTTQGQGLEEGLDPAVTFHCMRAPRSLRSILPLAGVLRRTSPSHALVIGPTNMAGFRAAAVLAGFRGDVLWRISNSPLGLLASYPRWERALKKPVLAWDLRNASRLIALNSAMATELRTVWRVPDDRITLIPNGVALPEGTDGRPEPKDPPVILCVGRLQPQKDHDTLLRAFALLAKRRRCRLRLAGDGPLWSDLEALATRLGIADRVEFLGHVSDTGALYRQARVTVLSSRFEGFGLVLIEALAHGCPVVSTDCPSGPADVIDSPEVGFLARVGDPEDLAEKIEAALDRHFDPTRLLSRAEHFSLDRLHQRVSALFLEKCVFQ